MNIGSVVMLAIQVYLGFLTASSGSPSAGESFDTPPQEVLVHAVSKPRMEWKVDFGQGIKVGPVVAPDGWAYIASWPGSNLTAIKPDGSRAWTIRFTSPVAAAPAFGPSGDLFLSCEVGVASRVDPHTGSILWTQDLGRPVATSLAIAADGMIIATTVEGQILALSDSGDLLWRNRVSERQMSSPSIDGSGNIYAHDSAFMLWKVSSEGQIIWTRDLGAVADSIGISYEFNYSGEPPHPVMIDEGPVVVIGRAVVRLDRFSKVIWTYTTSWDISSQPVVQEDNSLYFGNSDYRVYAVSNEGELMWTAATDDHVLTVPVALNDGYILAGSTDYLLYLLDPDGTIVWSFLAHPGLIGTHLSLDSERGRVLYSSSGALVSVKIGNWSLAQSSWPMFRGGSSYSGRPFKR